MNFLSKFAGVRVLVIGDVMLDRYWWGSVSRISPEAPVPVVSLERTTLAAGGAANVAANIVGLGASVTLVGITGDDAEAAELSHLLNAGGISTATLVRVAGRRTSVKTRIIAHSQQVVRVDNEMIDAIIPEIEEAVWNNISSALPAADLVIISDYAKGLLTATLVSRLIDAAKTTHKTVVIDPKGKDYTKYRGASLITPNKHEAAEACNLEIDTPGLVELCGSRLLTDLDVEMALVTEGEDGMTLFQKGSDLIHVPASASSVYDVTGAGDTVIATLGVALAVGLSFEKAARLANVAAGLVVQKVGTTAITLAMLERA